LWVKEAIVEDETIDFGFIGVVIIFNMESYQVIVFKENFFGAG
jgi:hypothetical protein